MMFNKKAQTINEYAILLGVVVAAFVAMQAINKTVLQARIKDIADYIGPQKTSHYDPLKGEFYSSEFTTNYVGTRLERKKGGLQAGRTFYYGIDDTTETKGVSEYTTYESFEDDFESMDEDDGVK